MAVKILYRNRIQTISTDSSSAVDEDRMIEDSSWKTWKGDSESSTSIYGIFGPTSPGDEFLVEAVAFVHNLPLDSTATITLYNGGHANPGDVVHESSAIPLMQDLSSEGIFHASELDANGHLIEDERNWHVFVYYLPTSELATELDIDLSYSATIDPVIRWVFAGEALGENYCKSKQYEPSLLDASLHSYGLAYNKFSNANRRVYGLEFEIPFISPSSRLKLEQARLYLGTDKPAIVDIYAGDSDYRSAFDRVWGKFQKPLRVRRRPDTGLDWYIANGLIIEH